MGIREEIHDALDERDFPRPTLLAEAMSLLDDRPSATHRWQPIVAAVLACVLVGTLLVIRAHQQPPSSVGNGVASCPVTRPPQPAFVPSVAYPKTPPAGEAWYGTPELWTTLTPNGTWTGLPHDMGGYTQKVFWWRDASDWRTDQLTVTGVRIDGAATPLTTSTVTSASGTDIGTAMLVVIDIPAAGCWEIKGRYKEATLTFVVWVAA